MIYEKKIHLTRQIKTMLEEAAEEMQRSESDIVADAVFNYLSDRSRFITCPNCNSLIFPKELIAVSGTGEFECLKCNTRILYDPDEDKIL